MTIDDQAQPKRSRWKRWAIIAGLIGLVAAIIAAAIWQLLLRPVQGTFSAKSVKADKLAVAPVITYKSLKGKTFSLEYPSNFAPETMLSKNSYTGLDNFILATSNIAGNDHLAVSVANANGPLVSDSSYHYRTMHPELYTATSQLVHGDTVYVFVKTDGGYEQTIFIPHKDLMGTLSLTSPNTDKASQGTVMSRVLLSFQWLNP